MENQLLFINSPEFNFCDDVHVFHLTAALLHTITYLTV